MIFNFTCSACNGNLIAVRDRNPLAMIVVCGACGVRYHVSTGPDHHVVRYLGNLDPIFPSVRCAPAIVSKSIDTWERDGGLADDQISQLARKRVFQMAHSQRTY